MVPANYRRPTQHLSRRGTKARFRQTLILVLGLFSLFIVNASAQKTIAANGPGPVKAQHVTVEMVTAGPSIAAGGQQTVGFVFTLEDKWHIYWKNAGFAGFPPTVEWTLPRDIHAGELQFPAPTRLPFQGAVDYGYEDSVTYPVVVQAGSKAKADRLGNVKLEAKLKWLVCRELCVPGNADLSMNLKLAAAGSQVASDGLHVGPLASALAHVPKQLPAGFSAKVTGSGDQMLLTLITGTAETDAEFYPLDENLLQDNADQPVEGLPNGIQIHLTTLPGTKLPQTLHGVVELSDDEAYELTAGITPGSVPLAKSTAVAGSSTSKITLISALGLALLGGVILNLMPCVFPVLFLKALSLVQSSGEEKSRLRVHGLAYAVGILVSFWVVVAALLILRAGGNRFGWGFQLQSPGFVAVLALFLFLFALSLAGLFDIGLSLTSAGDSLTRKQGLAGSFFTGILATVVATPCVGPFMGVAIGFALSQPPLVTFAVFTALALGLALPYLAISWFPVLMQWLPKPGAWMEILKQVTSLPLFATVIWMLYLYGRLWSGSDPAQGIYQVAVLLGAMLIVAIAGWVLGRWPGKRIPSIIAVAAIALSVLITFRMRPNSVQAASQITWEPFSQSGVDAARQAGHAVFVDYTAAWCLSCQVNERLVLKSSDVQEALRSSGFTKMRADWTQYDPAITAALTAVGRSGVPTYVIYPSKPGMAPQVLPEVLTKSGVVSAIQQNSK